MDEKELTVEMAQRFIEMEAEIEALRQVLNRSWPPANDPWPQFVDKGKNQLLAHEINHQRLDAFRASSNAATDDAYLIRILHEEILRRGQVS